MLEGQQQLGEVMVSSYKNEAANSLVNVFLASDSLESFIRNVTYYNSIEQQKAEQIAEQKRLTKEFNTVLEELDKHKNDRRACCANRPKKEQAEQVVSSAASKGFIDRGRTRTCRGAAKSKRTLDDLEASAAKT